MSAEERLRRRVAELEQALEACAATGVSSAVIAALVDGELTTREIEALTGFSYYGCRAAIKRLQKAGVVEPAYFKQTGAREAIAYRLVTKEPQ